MDAATKWLITATPIMFLLLLGYYPGEVQGTPAMGIAQQVIEEEVEPTDSINEIPIFEEQGFELIRKTDLRYVGTERVQYEVYYDGTSPDTALPKLCGAITNCYGLPVSVRVLVLSREDPERCTMICTDGEYERIQQLRY